MQSQTPVSNSPEREFDKAIGTKNLAFNNGTIHNNTFRSIDDSHRYFGKNDYFTGAVFYDGQLYQNLKLKYDLLTDALIIKLDGENNKAGFNAVSSKINYFYLENRKFTNLGLAKHPDFVKGFYEEKIFAEGFVLYTKHYKDRIEVLTNKSVFNRYYEKFDFVLYHNLKWHKINTERDIIALFPEFSTTISNYYLMRASLEKSDKKQFLEGLFGQINNSLTNR